MATSWNEYEQAGGQDNWYSGVGLNLKALTPKTAQVKSIMTWNRFEAIADESDEDERQISDVTIGDTIQVASVGKQIQKEGKLAKKQKTETGKNDNDTTD